MNWTHDTGVAYGGAPGQRCCPGRTTPPPTPVGRSSHPRSRPMRVLHVNKFLYRRGGAEGYLLDVAELQRGDGDEVAFFGMTHPDNDAPTPYARHFPSLVELDPAPARRGTPRGGGGPDDLVAGQPAGPGPGARRVPARRGPPAQHLPPALPVGAGRGAGRPGAGGDDPARLQAGLPELPDARPGHGLRRLRDRGPVAGGPSPLQGRFARGQRAARRRVLAAPLHPARTGRCRRSSAPAGSWPT